MIVVGVDSHKRTHTMVAIDPGGRKLGEKTVEATTTGHLCALQWAHNEFGRDLVWGVEDTRTLTARLERDLLDAGERVVRCPTQLMARTRKSARTRGKSDPIDALAVARAVQREPDLPVATHTPWSRDLKLLVDRREDLVQQRTATVQRLLWRVHELDPARRVKSGALNWRKQQDALAVWLETQSGLVAELARDELADIARLTTTINGLERRVAKLVRSAAPSLIEVYGVGDLSAARIIGETADVNRFRSEAAFARFAGLAPVPAWSGSTRGRVRAYKGGNRQINAALHQVAKIQIKKGAIAEGYYWRRRDEWGDKHGAAMLHVKRRIARTVYARLRADRTKPPALIADLARRNDDWARHIIPPPVQTPPTRRPRSRTHSAPTLFTDDPRIADLARRNDEWAAAL